MSNSIALGRSSPESAVSDAVTEANSAAGTSFKWRFGIALFLIIEALLAFAPLAILGPAIGWPASLRNLAAQQLAAIAAAPAALSLGYSIYLLYSLAILPVAVIVAWRVTGLNGKLSALIVALGALSALSRVIGILRWLTVMPMLATSYAAADPATRVAIELTFSAINSYGGGIGEVLGVALFGGLWLAVAMLAASGMSGRARTLPRWLIIFGGASALLQMALALPAFGIAMHVPVAGAVTAFVLWLIAFAVQLVVAPNSTARVASRQSST